VIKVSEFLQSAEYEESKIRRNNSLSKTMKNIAERDKCPKCGRKSAMTKMVTNDIGKPIGFQCRFCKHIKYFFEGDKKLQDQFGY